MRKSNSGNIFPVIVVAAMILLAMALIFVTLSQPASAVAEAAAATASEDESALLTENDDIEGYAGKTIRDYESVRTIPDISRQDARLTLNTAVDDVITKIVPKQFFMTAGNELYIGREYGFFIHTENCADIAGSSNMYSTVLVFDIDNVTDMVANKDTAVTKVTVLYQYEFIYLSPQESHYTVLSTEGDFLITKIHFDAAHSGIVIPLARGTADIRNYNQVSTYYLNDVSFAASLLNAQNLDYIDAEYDAAVDPGAFFTGSRYFYNGKVAVDKEIIAGQHAEWLYDFVGLLGGALTMTPGTSLLGVTLLLADLIVVASDIATSDFSKENDVSNDCIIATAQYKTRLEQLQYDGHLMKTIACAVNSDEVKTYVFGAGDNVRMEYDISSTPTDKVPYTWFRREIALSVVDGSGDYSTVATAVGRHEFKLYEEDYVEVNLDGGTVYLLPNDSNTFTFTPEFSGEYVFGFGASGIVGLSIDGVSLTEGVGGFHVDLEGGKTYDIRVTNKTGNRVISDFTVEPAADRAVTVEGNDSYIVKLDLDSPQCRTVTTDNGNLDVGVYVKDSDGTLSVYSPGGYAWDFEQAVTFPFEAGEYYIVLHNNSSSEVSANITVDAVPAVAEGENTVSFGTNWAYYEFIPTASDYAFTIATTMPYAQMQLYDASMNGVTINSGSMMFTVYGLTPGQSYYLAIRTDETDNASGTVAIGQKENAYAWYVDGEKITGQNVTLDRGWDYNIELVVNGEYSLRSFLQYYNDGSVEIFGHNAAIERNISIPADAEVGINVMLSAPISDDYEITYKLFVEVAPNTMVVAAGHESFYEKTDFFFEVNDPKVEKINYRVSYQNMLFVRQEYNGSVDVSGTGVVAVSTSIGVQIIYNGTFEVTSIVYDGREENYSTESSSKSFNMFYGKGTGTADDPYVINCNYHYLNFALAQTAAGVYWKLNTDIESTFAKSEFYGVFDGGGHTISGFSMTIPNTAFSAEQNYGWIHKNYGTVMNVKFKNATITSEDCQTGAYVNVGIVAGYNSGIIEDVEVSGASIEINRNASRVGAIVGYNTGTVRGCFVSFVAPLISGSGDMGTICGRNESGTIDSCSALLCGIDVYINTVSRSIGGIVGYSLNGTVKNCNAALVVITIKSYTNVSNPAPAIGGIVGRIDNGRLEGNNAAGGITDNAGLTDQQKVNCNFERGYGVKYGNVTIIE